MAELQRKHWVKFSQPYQGTEPDTGEPIRVEEGETVELSEAKIAQLDNDFPGLVSKSKEPAGPKPKATVTPDVVGQESAVAAEPDAEAEPEKPGKKK